MECWHVLVCLQCLTDGCNLERGQGTECGCFLKVANSVQDRIFPERRSLSGLYLLYTSLSLSANSQTSQESGMYRTFSNV